MDLELSIKLGELLSESQNGDSRSYEEFLRLIYGLVERAVATKLKTNREDVVQEVLLSLHNARHSFLPSRHFYPWFYAIVNARIIDEKRRMFREGRKIEAYGKEAESIGTEEKTINSINEDISAVLQDLPENQRRIIELNKLHGYSMKEIASQLGLSVANVKVIAHRGLSNLKSAFKDKNDG